MHLCIHEGHRANHGIEPESDGFCQAHVPVGYLHHFDRVLSEGAHCRPTSTGSLSVNPSLMGGAYL